MKKSISSIYVPWHEQEKILLGKLMPCESLVEIEFDGCYVTVRLDCDAQNVDCNNCPVKPGYESLKHICWKTLNRSKEFSNSSIFVPQYEEKNQSDELRPCESETGVEFDGCSVVVKLKCEPQDVDCNNCPVKTGWKNVEMLRW